MLGYIDINYIATQKYPVSSLFQL